jgi:hypothetical protein
MSKLGENFCQNLQQSYAFLPRTWNDGHKQSLQISKQLFNRYRQGCSGTKNLTKTIYNTAF